MEQPDYVVIAKRTNDTGRIVKLKALTVIASRLGPDSLENPRWYKTEQVARSILNGKIVVRGIPTDEDGVYKYGPELEVFVRTSANSTTQDNLESLPEG